jgi:hypothetical protein
MSEGYLRKTNDTLALSKIFSPEIRLLSSAEQEMFC